MPGFLSTLRAMNRSHRNEGIGEKVDEADTYLSPDQLPNTNK